MEEMKFVMEYQDFGDDVFIYMNDKITVEIKVFFSGMISMRDHKTKKPMPLNLVDNIDILACVLEDLQSRVDNEERW